MKIVALFVSVRSVSHGALDLTGRGGAPFAALTALPLQLGVAAQLESSIETADGVFHLQAVERLHGREDIRVGFLK